MSVTSALVLLAVVWFLVLFLVLPVRVQSQSEAGRVVRGTPGSAPAGAVMAGKLRLTSLIALPLWAVITALILWSGLSVRDLDWFQRMGPGGGWHAPGADSAPLSREG